MSSQTIIGIPTDDKVFESNCISLFAGLLNDPNVKYYGTRGKAQSGLDLIGRRDRNPNQPVGIQCKLITRGAKLTEATVRAEVAQALTIQPPLTEFYVVTTASDEPALDNLAIELSQAQAKAGPPYSPDLNPIEQVFAKLKLLLRKAAERTVDATWQRIGDLLDAFPPNECAKYLRNSGYASA